MSGVCVCVCVCVSCSDYVIFAGYWHLCIVRCCPFYPHNRILWDFLCQACMNVQDFVVGMIMLAEFDIQKFGRDLQLRFIY